MINDTILRRKHDRVNTRSDSASQAAGRGAKWSKARTDVHALQQKLETSLRIIQVLQVWLQHLWLVCAVQLQALFSLEDFVAHCRLLVKSSR